MGHSASMMLRVVRLHDLANGYKYSFALPDDFMERLKVETGQVSLGSGWERIHDAFDGSAVYDKLADSDLLYLEDGAEDEAIAALRVMIPPRDARLSEWERSISDAIEALEAMRDTRLALGLTEADWVLG